MALIRSSKRITRDLDENSRRGERDFEGLLKQLGDPDPQIRRLGARDLAAYQRAASALSERLPLEDDLAVREAILGSLVAIGGDQAVRGLAPLLKSEDANLRNGAIEALQQLPQAVEPFLETMLGDPDPDARLMAVNVLALMPLAQAPDRLLQVASEDEHINVVAAALNALAEVGESPMIPTLLDVKERFKQEPFLCFVVDTVIRRIKG